MRSYSKAASGAAVIAVAALAACSGSGSPSTPVLARSDAPSGFAHATFKVNWPAAASTSNARHRDVISSSTASITVSVDGAAPYVVNKPTLSGSPSSTSVTITAPIGTDSFAFAAWDEAGGAGNVLDKATTSQLIVANANNTVSVTLDGVCAALVAAVPTSAYEETTTTSVPIAAGKTQNILAALRLVGPSAQTVTINEVDPDGNTIVNSAGAPPIALNEVGSTPHVTIAPSSSSPGNNKFSLTALAAEPDGFSTTIAATSQNCGTSPTLPNSFAFSTSALVYVADSAAGILAYDQDGTKLATISTTKGITGLGYNSSSNSLVAVEPTSATKGGITFQTLSATGSSLGSGTLSVSSSLANPVGNIAYNPANGYFLTALREYVDSSSTTHYGTVLEYTISGSTGTAVKPTGTNPFAESSSTPPPYDPDAFAIYPSGNVVVGDSQTDSYLFDKNGNYLNANGYPAATLAYDSLRGSVLEFQPQEDYVYAVNSAQTYIAQFTTPGASTVNYTAAAYAPGADALYGFAGAYAFRISGATAAVNSGTTLNTLPSGAFAGLTAPTQAVVVP